MFLIRNVTIPILNTLFTVQSFRRSLHGNENLETEISMTSINIPLEERTLAKLQSLANEVGKTPEQLIVESIQQLIQNDNCDVIGAAKYVLAKNKELYRRLAL